MNKFIFNIGIFPFVMSVVTTIFLRPDWPRVVYRWLTGDPNPQRFDHIEAKAVQKKTDVPPRQQRRGLNGRQKVILLLLGVFCAFQTLWPLRHHLYSGQVVWNEEGHMCSWRMKVRYFPFD